jgi:hypothetical protein
VLFNFFVSAGPAFLWFGVILDFSSRVAIKHCSASRLLVARRTVLATKPSKIGHSHRPRGEQLLRRRDVSIRRRVGSREQFRALDTNNIWKALTHTVAELLIGTVVHTFSRQRQATIVAESGRKSSAFHNRQQQSKSSRTGKPAIQLAGSAVEGSLDLEFCALTEQALR